ncbi:MAG TPA: glycosyltransferase [Syntrophorhabdaceae bacterium]|nr:glycosyltransferase [Syntrophorhabdaceae bacterium]HPU29319.1 glycosyltransferase [Syntrophorhabdaceae bacterium]
MKEKVSVIIATYNNENTIAKAIDSILNQTYDNWECVICDDASSDGTKDVICGYKEKYGEKIIYIENINNCGPAYSRNRCIDIARGEYIAIQDADDISLPERLDKQVKFLNENKDISAVGTYAVLINDKGEEWGINKPLCFPIKENWVKGPQVIHASTMIRKKDLLDVGKYNENLRRVEDYHLWLKMILKGYNIATIPEILYKIHLNEASYRRRSFKYRWDEAITIYHAIKEMHVPFIYYCYFLKPLINGIIPNKLIYLYHKQKFGKHNKIVKFKN